MAENESYNKIKEEPINIFDKKYEPETKIPCNTSEHRRQSAFDMVEIAWKSISKR